MKSITIFDRKVSDQIFAKPQLSLNGKVETLLEESQKVLFRASSVFPFDFFPDVITIDECKVNIVAREFFFSEDIHSIPIEMIKDIEIESGPLFATLKIVPDGYPGHTPEVHHLRKQDAIKARRIIQGLMVASKHDVDLGNINVSKSKLLSLIESIGSSHVTE